MIQRRRSEHLKAAVGLARAMPRRDDRPFLLLAGVLVLLALAFLVPTSRAWLDEEVLGPLRAQADPDPDARRGYSFASLLAWAFLGGVFAWAAYELVFVRAGFEPDRPFFLALAPALLLGPLLHAAVAARAFPAGGVLAYLGAEPLVYLTVALLAGIGLWLGRVAQQPVLLPLLWGALALAPLVWIMAPRLDPNGARLAGILLAFAIVPAALLAAAYTAWKKDEPRDAVFAVIAAHALDGATTWMVLRDPFDLGFGTFGERNPVSETLVNLSNGWPYFALKLALPLVLLTMVRRDQAEARLRAFLLFAVFILGFGPGMANLLQVMFG